MWSWRPPRGNVRFIEVTDGIEFRSELQKAFREGYLALGLLGGELTGKTIQARSMLFPWHKENAKLGDLFQRLCEEGADSVQGEFERRSVN